MGWLQRFIAFISCKSCKNVDERGLQRRNVLRKKLGKNKIEPEASTDLDIKVENVSPSTRDLKHFVVCDGKGDELTPEDKWAAPRAPSQASAHSGASSAASFVSDISRAASARAGRAINTAYNQIKEERRQLVLQKEKEEMVKNRGGAEDGGVICDRIPSQASLRSGATSASSFVSDISRAASARVRRAIDTACNQLIEELKVAELQKNGNAAGVEAEKNRGEAEDIGVKHDTIEIEDLETQEETGGLNAAQL